jgi:hypothetical protein
MVNMPRSRRCFPVRRFGSMAWRSLSLSCGSLSID